MSSLIWYLIRSDAVLFPQQTKSPTGADCISYLQASKTRLTRNVSLQERVGASQQLLDTSSPKQSIPPTNGSPSIPLPRRLRTRTPTHTFLIMAPRAQPLLRPQLQLPLQLRTRLLAMYEIAEAAANTAFAAVEPTARFPEIGHGRQLAVDGAGGVPAAVERVAGRLRRVFVFEARVHVADEI